MRRHTSFPWNAERDYNGELAIWHGDDNLLHSESDLDIDEREFNGELMARGPEILWRMTEEFTSFLAFSETYGPSERASHTDWSGHFEGAHAVIKKSQELFGGNSDDTLPPRVKLVFKAHEDNTELKAFGITMLDALADLERKIIAYYGGDACLSHNYNFTSRLFHLFETLDAPGKEWDAFDFSTPEEGFTITRIA